MQHAYKYLLAMFAAIMMVFAFASPAQADYRFCDINARDRGSYLTFDEARWSVPSCWGYTINSLPGIRIDDTRIRFSSANYYYYIEKYFRYTCYCHKISVQRYST